MPRGVPCVCVFLPVSHGATDMTLSQGGHHDTPFSQSELISSKGYPVEDYEVTTTDGFVLKIQRIPHGKEDPLCPPKKNRKEVAFLQHGLLGSSADWVINFPSQSLGFTLADAGYDVWLGNVRGNTYSRHLHYTREDSEFWNFSFDQMIEYDLPATLAFVLKVAGANKLHYVGHSQGTLIMFGLLSERPKYKEKIKLFTALAPVTTLIYARSPIRLLTPFAEEISLLLRLLGNEGFLTNDQIIKLFADIVCTVDATKPVCELPLTILYGSNPKQRNETRLPVYINHIPAGTSVKYLVHFAQLIKQKAFQKFDYGPEKNKLKYGQARPPRYDVSKVAAPVALYWSQNDLFADPKDVSLLRSKLPNVVLYYRVPDKQFTHLDFAYGIHANRNLYPVVLRTLRNHD
ncbi:gastric triacylglycerol lipase-like [Ornithodoros turicata]|uniref:gastric triacylglycerol lipase-like n=1 Tax=Ornithodoros turicata TaxID=34597 RepID=UPI0031386230